MSVRKFLVVADDTPEVRAALRYACRRAARVGGRVALLRTLEPTDFEHWSGVREEMERQTRAEAEAALQSLAEEAVSLTGDAPELLLRPGDVWPAIRGAVADDPDIKVLVLASAVGGRGPGPLITALGKGALGWAGRRLAVTIVPGDLSDEEVLDLA
jgi:nucleotide-binding universal stress UspA family protein